jgi:hypothetical protein
LLIYYYSLLIDLICLIRDESIPDKEGINEELMTELRSLHSAHARIAELPFSITGFVRNAGIIKENLLLKRKLSHDDQDL